MNFFQVRRLSVLVFFVRGVLFADKGGINYKGVGEKMKYYIEDKQ